MLPQVYHKVYAYFALRKCFRIYIQIYSIRYMKMLLNKFPDFGKKKYLFFINIKFFSTFQKDWTTKNIWVGFVMPILQMHIRKSINFRFHNVRSERSWPQPSAATASALFTLECSFLRGFFYGLFNPTTAPRCFGIEFIVRK